MNGPAINSLSSLSVNMLNALWIWKIRDRTHANELAVGVKCTCAAFWRGNPKGPTCHPMLRIPGVPSRGRAHRSSPDYGQDAPARPRSRPWRWTKPLWSHRSSTRPRTVRRCWSNSSGRRIRVLTAGRRAAPRSRGCCKSGGFCRRSTWRRVCRRRRTSWRHLDGLVKCRSEMSFVEPVLGGAFEGMGRAKGSSLIIINDALMFITHMSY